MSPQYILGAAIEAMVNGHKRPHCYRAWVQYKGYVNDGSLMCDRPDYLRQLQRDAEAQIENLRHAEGYAEPGYEQLPNGVLLADWNHFPNKIDDLLAKKGYTCEYPDEWSICENCNKVFRVEPDGFCWEPYFSQADPSVCLRCYREEHAHENEGAL